MSNYINNDINEWVSFISSMLGIIGFAFSILTFVYARYIKKSIKEEEIKKNEKIKVYLESGEYRYFLYEIKRYEVTREAIWGRIGLIPTKSSRRFTFDYSKFDGIYNKINDIQNGIGNELIIEFKKEEFSEFKEEYIGLHEKKKIN